LFNRRRETTPTGKIGISYDMDTKSGWYTEDRTSLAGMTMGGSKKKQNSPNRTIIAIEGEEQREEYLRME